MFSHFLATTHLSPINGTVYIIYNHVVKDISKLKVGLSISTKPKMKEWNVERLSLKHNILRWFGHIERMPGSEITKYA